MQGACEAFYRLEDHAVSRINDVSEEHIVSIFRVRETGWEQWQKGPISRLILCLLPEKGCHIFSRNSGRPLKTTRPYNPEGGREVSGKGFTGVASIKGYST
jgi:hypothetical protein